MQGDEDDTEDVALRFSRKRFLALRHEGWYIVRMKEEKETSTEEKRAARFGVSLNELLARQDLQPFVEAKKGGVEIWKTQQLNEQGS